MSDHITLDAQPAVTKYYNAQAIGLLALVIWELILTSRYEWKSLKKRPLPHWSITFYLLCRIALFLHLLFIVVNLFDTEALDCNAQAWILNITSTLVIWSSGALLALRLLDLWKKEERILGFLGVGLSGLLVVNCLSWQTPDYTWDHTLSRCVPNGLHKAITIALFFYTFLFFCSLSVVFGYKQMPRKSWPEVRQMVVQDGLGIYIIVTFVFFAQAVLSSLWIDDLINTLFLSPALTITTIAISRSYVINSIREERLRASNRGKLPVIRPGPPSSWRKSSAVAASTYVPGHSFTPGYASGSASGSVTTNTKA